MTPRNLWLTIFAFCLTTSPSLVSAETPSPSPDTLEQRVKALEDRLNELENIPAVAIALKEAKESASTVATPSPTPQADSPLVIAGDWDYTYNDAQYDFDKRHIISYCLKNRTHKDIKLVDASLVFRDRLGQQILMVRAVRDVIYPADAPTQQTGVWPLNMFEGSPQRMRSLPHDDVILTLIVRKVVFADNTIWSADQSH